MSGSVDLSYAKGTPVPVERLLSPEAVRDPTTGKADEWARRCQRDMREAAHYLMLLPTRGAERAAQEVCEEHGHRIVRGSCERCGARVMSERDEWLAGRGGRPSTL